jgi:tetratricopeptide (TPR) repeat protein
LPAAILLIVWWKRGKRGRLVLRDVLPLLPLFALGLLMSWKTATMEREIVGGGMFGPEWNFSFADRLLIAGRAVWFYAYKLLWPAKLIFIYPRWPIDPHQPWQWSFPLAAIALIASAWALRNRIGRGMLAALLLFGGTLFPALGFVNVYPMRYSFVADHFQYLASIALIVLIVAAAAKHLRRGLPFAGVLILVVLAILTWRRQSAFADLRSLWTDTIDKNPGAWMARVNYAKLLIEEKNYPAAEKQIQDALKTDEDNPDVLTQLGVIFELTGRIDQAIEVYTTVTQFAQNDWMAQYHLGRLLAERGKVPAALFHLQRSIDESPNYAPAHEELARILAAQGQTDRAIMQLEQAAALDPDLVSAQNNLVTGLLSAGRVDLAEARLREILRRFPDSATAHNNLGVVLEQRGDVAGAVGEYERALKIDPEYAAAKQNLSRLRRTHP